MELLPVDPEEELLELLEELLEDELLLDDELLLELLLELEPLLPPNIMRAKEYKLLFHTFMSWPPPGYTFHRCGTLLLFK